MLIGCVPSRGSAVRDGPGYIYIFSRPDGLRKLGWSVDVRRRRTAWNMETGLRHTIERVWAFNTEHTAFCVESDLHYELKTIRDRLGTGRELYHLPLDILTELVNGSFDKHLGMSKAGFLKALKRARDWQREQEVAADAR